ncbi:MAG: PPC domain-containing protein, partial [Bacteroidota bacterium]
MKLRTTLSFLICCVFFCTAFSQGDLCNSSKIIPVECRKKVSGSNLNSGNSLTHANYNGCTSRISASQNPYTGNDVIYKVSVDGSNLRIALEDLSADLDLFVFRGCYTQGQCFYKSTNSGNADEVLQIPFADGTYYIVVDGNDASQKSNFNLTVICRQGDDGGDGGYGGGGGSNCNDNACYSAQSIGCGQEIHSTTKGKSSNLNKECNYGTHCANGHSDYKAGDRVFKVNVPYGKDKLNINLSHFNKNLDLFVFRNGCKLNQCVAASQRNSAYSESITINNPSGVYYIVVDGYGQYDESDFKLSVECKEDDDNGGGGGNGYSCSTEQTLTCDNTYNLSNEYGSNNLTYNDYGSCVNGWSSSSYPYSGKDVVYKVYVAEKGDLEINMTNLSKNLDMFLYRSCNSYGGYSGCLAVSRKDGNWSEQIKLSNVDAGYYFLVVDGRDQYQWSNFKISVKCEKEQSHSCDTEKTLTCGNSYNLSNEYGSNNLTYSDYGSCVNGWSASSYPYSGKDVVYRVYVAEKSD